MARTGNGLLLQGSPQQSHQTGLRTGRLGGNQPRSAVNLPTLPGREACQGQPRTRHRTCSQEQVLRYRYPARDMPAP